MRNVRYTIYRGIQNRIENIQITSEIQNVERQEIEAVRGTFSAQRSINDF